MVDLTRSPPTPSAHWSSGHMYEVNRALPFRPGSRPPPTVKGTSGPATEYRYRYHRNREVGTEAA
eukprot:scaffold2556_cov425-Prasinococcus_capsulatus_cf.AAC.7